MHIQGIKVIARKLEDESFKRNNFIGCRPQSAPLLLISGPLRCFRSHRAEDGATAWVQSASMGNGRPSFNLDNVRATPARIVSAFSPETRQVETTSTAQVCICERMHLMKDYLWSAVLLNHGSVAFFFFSMSQTPEQLFSGNIEMFITAFHSSRKCTGRWGGMSVTSYLLWIDHQFRPGLFEGSFCTCTSSGLLSGNILKTLQ